ncbi:multiubiquitin domain-containing protein [Mucilaginibacter sp. OK098]|uniref:multiubiquitin domain-containing protein n=1 Tax=Mucilaginibacter sp. OK098 TaxID=1855297 RepID=UPI00091D334B|nr:multiubiquitin domain-containing protein [Mucilaginibacter sp. OK098]SHN32854.1 Multiubiquitin [Mucilaginibacter sp. OK098]
MNIHEILIIDIELYVRENREIPRGHHYLIMVDRLKYKVEKECLTGHEILKLAGKTPPERFQLNQRYKGGKVTRIGYDQEVSFVEPGVEKFMTIPLDQTEGEK